MTAPQPEATNSTRARSGDANVNIEPGHTKRTLIKQKQGDVASHRVSATAAKSRAHPKSAAILCSATVRLLQRSDEASETHYLGISHEISHHVNAADGISSETLRQWYNKHGDNDKNVAAIFTTPDGDIVGMSPVTRKLGRVEDLRAA